MEQIALVYEGEVTVIVQEAEIIRVIDRDMATNNTYL